MVIAIPEGTSSHFGGNVRVKSKIQRFVPIRRGAVFLLFNLRDGLPWKRHLSLFPDRRFGRGLCRARGWFAVAARSAFRKLGCQKIGEGPDSVAGEARLQIFLVARKVDIEAEEIEADDGLLERRTGLCVEKSQHDFIAGGRREAEVENILPGPS